MINPITFMYEHIYYGPEYSMVYTTWKYFCIRQSLYFGGPVPFSLGLTSESPCMLTFWSDLGLKTIILDNIYVKVNVVNRGGI